MTGAPLIQIRPRCRCCAKRLRPVMSARYEWRRPAPDQQPERVRVPQEWDGSWHGYGTNGSARIGRTGVFFCSLRCALEFAAAAVLAGWTFNRGSGRTTR